MAERGFVQAYRLAVSADEAWRSLACRRATDVGGCHTGSLRRGNKGVALCSRNSTDDLVIVAATKKGFDQGWFRGQSRPRRIRQRNAHDVDLRSDARGAAKFCKITGKTIGNIHRG